MIRNILWILCAAGSLAVYGQQADQNDGATWVHAAMFELTGRTGNTEKNRHTGSVTSIRTSKVNRLKLYAGYAWAAENGLKTEEEYKAGIDDEASLSDRTSWYGRMEYENDDIEALRHRFTAATGLGYYFLKEEKHKLRGRLGLFWRDEDYKIGSDNQTFGLEVGVYHQYHIRDWGILTSEAVYSPSLESHDDYRVTYESKLEMPFKNLDILSLEMGVSGEYSNKVPPGLERFDTFYFIRFKLTW